MTNSTNCIIAIYNGKKNKKNVPLPLLYILFPPALTHIVPSTYIFVPIKLTVLIFMLTVLSTMLIVPTIIWTFPLPGSSPQFNCSSFLTDEDFDTDCRD